MISGGHLHEMYKENLVTTFHGRTCCQGHAATKVNSIQGMPLETEVNSLNRVGSETDPGSLDMMNAFHSAYVASQIKQDTAMHGLGTHKGLTGHGTTDHRIVKPIRRHLNLFKGHHVLLLAEILIAHRQANGVARLLVHHGHFYRDHQDVVNSESSVYEQ